MGITLQQSTTQRTHTHIHTMGLEACMVVLDNSAYALNGDYGSSTRWLAQQDATKVLFNAKTGSNPESTVGLMTSAGKGPEVLVTPTSEFGRIASALHGIRTLGDADVVTSIQVAQLALKHRQNKNQRQRVIVFVGSPLEKVSGSELVKLGKKMKKNNVAVDVVSFGEDAENEEKLREFVESVNSSENSHLVSIPAGTVLLSDMILSSPMLAEDGVMPSGSGGAAAGGSGGGEDGEYGVDPNLDPELAMALRMSLEEERARQQRTQAPASGQDALPSVKEDSTSAATPSGSLPADLAASTSTGPAAAPALNEPAATSSASSAGETATTTTTGVASDATIKAEDVDTDMAGDEDEDLAMALALSRGEDDEMDEAHGDEGDDSHDVDDDGADEEGMTEEEAIARAIEMSMKEQQGDPKP